MFVAFPNPFKKRGSDTPKPQEEPSKLLPFIDKSPKKYLDDLLDVGPEKPMGYLPLRTIREHCQVDPPAVASYLQNKGLEIRQYDEDFCKVSSGALYAFDKVSLQQLLDRNRDISIANKWPIEADAFVEKVATVHTQDPELRSLIHEAFGNRGNR